MMEGGKTIELEASLEQIPLLVKAGSILPMEENQQLVLHLYPPVKRVGGAGDAERENPIQISYTLYSDAGDGYGESRLDRFCLLRHEKSLEFAWEQQGNYGFPDQSVQLHVHGMSLQQAWVDNQEAIASGQQLQCHFFRRVRFRCD